MAFQPFPDGAQAVIEVGNSDEVWTNTLWFRDLLGPPADFQALADYLWSWYASGVMPQLASFWDLRKVTVYDMSSALGQIWYGVGTPTSGARSGGPTPINVALVMTFYSAGRGRSSRGRNYVAGFSEDDVGGTELIAPTLITNLNTAYTNLIAGVQTGPGFEWVVASRVGLGVPRPEIYGFTITAAVARNAILGTQRRRIQRP
jgi:hypothetical protein